MTDEANVVVGEGLVVEKSFFPRCQEMKPHPQAAVVELEVVPPHIFRAFWRMPSGEVSARTIVRGVEALTVGGEHVNLPRAPFLTPR